MKNDIVILLKIVDELDDEGCKKGEIELSRNTVFAEEKSVTREEFFKAMQSGVSADAVFVINRDEYNRQNKVLYNGNTYRVYRTFAKDVYNIELMCERVE